MSLPANPEFAKLPASVFGHLAKAHAAVARRVGMSNAGKGPTDVFVGALWLLPWCPRASIPGMRSTLPSLPRRHGH